VAELRLILVSECRNCRRLSQVDVLALIERYGTHATLGETRQKGRCHVCKKRAADLLMWEPGSRKDLGWWPRPPHARRDLELNGIGEYRVFGIGA
jgi:hypothetical protein